MKSKFARAPLALAVSMLLAQSALAAIQTLPQVDRSLQSAGAKRADTAAPRLRVLMDGLPMVYDAKSLGIEGVARAHLDRILTRNGGAKAASEAFELVSASPMQGGAQIVQFKRRINGIEVFREDVGLLIDAKSRLVAFRGSERLFEPSAGKALQAFTLGESDAAAIALSAFGIDHASARKTLKQGRSEGDYRWFDIAGSQRSKAGAVNRNPIRVKAVYFPLAEGGVVPAWYVETQVQPGDNAETEYYAHVLSAVDGSVLFRHFQQADGGPVAFTYRVWAEPAPAGLPLPSPYGRNDVPHPTDSSSYIPPFVAPTLVTLANSPFSRSGTDGWLPSGATATTGNNTDAYLDLADPDGFDLAGDIRPDITAANTFDWTYNVAAEPAASAVQRKAASVQQFYWVNWLHDDYYDAGFAEVDGNAQTDNYGRGGLGNDSIKSEGQDNTGTCAPTCANNANMSTPADGARPRMQMYVWSSADRTLTVNGTTYLAGTASFGQQSFNLIDQGMAAALDAADASGPSTTDGCTALTNAAAVAGKIALIDRGTCGFTVKAKNAQNAGATGVVIANNQVSALPPGLGGTDATVTIPAMSVLQGDGVTIRALLGDANPDLGTMFRGGVGRDGTIDGMIISHEWGHYISNRLVGNASGLSNQKGRGMGEGWADFHSLLSAAKASDAAAGTQSDFGDSYAQGAYAGGTPYFGIRRYPYSTRLTINPLTFRHTVDGNTLPVSPPSAFGANGATNSEVHNTGEVWTAMLWECYAGLLNDTLGGTPRLTFAQARERMKEYVVGGYKLTPSAPTMVEARDAILATIAANDIDDFEICAAGFAKRGLGILAVDAPRQLRQRRLSGSGRDRQPQHRRAQHRLGVADRRYRRDHGQPCRRGIPVRCVGTAGGQHAVPDAKHQRADPPRFDPGQPCRAVHGHADRRHDRQSAGQCAHHQSARGDLRSTADVGNRGLQCQRLSVDDGPVRRRHAGLCVVPQRLERQRQPCGRRSGYRRCRPDVAGVRSDLGGRGNVLDRVDASLSVRGRHRGRSDQLGRRASGDQHQQWRLLGSDRRCGLRRGDQWRLRQSAAGRTGLCGHEHRLSGDHGRHHQPGYGLCEPDGPPALLGRHRQCRRCCGVGVAFAGPDWRRHAVRHAGTAEHLVLADCAAGVHGRLRVSLNRPAAPCRRVVARTGQGGHMASGIRINGLRRTRVAGLFLGLLGIALPALAENEQVTAHQSLDGQVHVTLTGLVSRHGNLGGLDGLPSGVVSGNSLNIVSRGILADSPPPNPDPDIPVPYMATINFGVLPPGPYNIAWQITVLGMPPIVATTQFDVLAAPLQTPVPLPANRFGWGMMLGVLGAGWWGLRRVAR